MAECRAACGADTTNLLCAACIQSLQKQLDELPKLAAALQLFLAATPKTALHGRVRNTPNPRCPLDLRVDTLLGEVEDVIDRSLPVAELIHQPKLPFLLWIDGTRQEKSLDGVQRALDIRRVHVKAHDFLGFNPVWQKRHAPCPKCGGTNLGNWIGEDHVECKDCAHRISFEDYQDYCTELIEAMRNDRLLDTAPRDQ